MKLAAISMLILLLISSKHRDDKRTYSCFIIKLGEQ